MFGRALALPKRLYWSFQEHLAVVHCFVGQQERDDGDPVYDDLSDATCDGL